MTWSGDEDRDAHRLDTQLLSDLWVFRAAARFGSITAAARRLNVTQGAVSQRVLRLEDAVRRMSALPANRLKLEDRGLLRPGMKADIAIFDAKTVGDRATFPEPHHYAVGYRDVLVNGKLVLREGKITEERPGRVLYGPAHQAN